MKTLFTFRHALPCPNYRGPDHERPLGDEGICDCENMGRRLQSLEIVPDVIYTSSADRARSTARIIAEVLGYPLANIIEDSQWYLASAASWMNTIQQIPENTNTAMIFGHNPGMADLAGALNQTSDHLSFSPLSGAFFRLDADYWGEVTSGSGQLIEMLSPNSPQM